MKLCVILMLILSQMLFSYSNAEENSNFPILEFTTINRYSDSTLDLDRVDDTRSFTSEALFAESSILLNYPLSKSELQGIIGVKQQFETFNNKRRGILFLNQFNIQDLTLFSF